MTLRVDILHNLPDCLSCTSTAVPVSSPHHTRTWHLRVVRTAPRVVRLARATSQWYLCRVLVQIKSLRPDPYTRIHLHTPPNPTCTRWFDLERLKVELYLPPPLLSMSRQSILRVACCVMAKIGVSGAYTVSPPYLKLSVISYIFQGQVNPVPVLVFPSILMATILDVKETDRFRQQVNCVPPRRQASAVIVARWNYSNFPSFILSFIPFYFFFLLYYLFVLLIT